MLCNFRVFQAESLPVLSKADVRKRVYGGEGAQPRLYLLCDSGDVPHFCRVKEEQLRLYLILTSTKKHTYMVNKILFHIRKLYLYLLTSFSHKKIS